MQQKKCELYKSKATLQYVMNMQNNMQNITQYAKYAWRPTVLIISTFASSDLSPYTAACQKITERLESNSFLWHLLLL